jgi:hypothetical protein
MPIYLYLIAILLLHGLPISAVGTLFVQITAYNSLDCTGAVKNVDAIALGVCAPYDNAAEGYAVYSHYSLPSGMVHVNVTLYIDSACMTVTKASSGLWSFTPNSCKLDPYSQHNQQISGVGMLVSQPIFPSNYLVAK